MNFNQLLDAVRATPDAVSIPAAWAQGRAAFGGLMAAMVYETMRLKLADNRPVRSLAISFVAPAAPGVPTRFEVEVLRLSLIHISEPTRPRFGSRMPSSA